MKNTYLNDVNVAKAKRRWLVMTPTALLVVFSILALIALFAVGARLDSDAEKAADYQMTEALHHAGDTLSALAKDNAWWDDAYENVTVNFSGEWIEKTWGSGGFSSNDGSIDGLMIVDQNARVLGGYGLNIEINQELADSMHDLKALVSAASDDPSEEPHSVVKNLRTSQGIVIAAAVPITPYEPRPDWNPMNRAVVVAFNVIDDLDFRKFEGLSGVTEMSLSDRIDEGRGYRLLLSNPSQRDASTWLTWTTPTPGTEMVHKMILPVSGLTILLLALSFGAGRAILANERMLATTAEHLASAHGLLRVAIDAIDEGIGVSIGGKARFWNDEFAGLVGFEDLKPGVCTSLVRQAVLDRGFKIIEGDVAVFQEGTKPGQWLMSNDKGRVLFVRRLPIPGGFMLVARDVTADHEAQREILKARREAEDANKSKSQFLAQMSHELRTPLNAIIGFSEVIAMGLFGRVEPASYGDYAKDIHRAGNHLLSLVNDVLDLSKIEAGRMEANLERVAIADIAEDARMLVGNKAEAKNLQLTMSGEHDLYMKADPKMVKQVLVNLLSNSVKFTPEGGSINVTWRRAEDGMAETIVRDTGIGMSKDELERALSPFGQVKPKKKVTDEPGTGLGLPIVGGLCKAQGGSFRIESTPNVGTTAIVSLPLEIAA